MILLRGIRKRAVVFIAALLFAVVAVIGILWGEALWRTAYITSHVMPAVPQWFEAGSHEVELREERFILSGGSEQVVDIYIPMGIARPGFLLFIPGFNPKGADDPRLVNLSRTFAAGGAGIAVIDSPTIRQQEFSRKDIERVKETFRFLQGQHYVDADRIGLSGFSVAGSYALRAASELGKEPLFVHSFGGYYNLEEVFAEVLSEKVVYQEKTRDWEPDPLPRKLLRKELAAHSKEDISLGEAHGLLQKLPDKTLRLFGRLSPSDNIISMETRVFLMHDKNDNLIPVEESRKIKDAMPENTPLHYSEFTIIAHVTPKDIFSFDVIKLGLQVLQIVRLLT